MKSENQKWHTLTLQMHTANMFETLLYPNHIITEGAKEYTFEDKEGLELDQPLRGYFAMKDVDGKKTKYFLDADHIDEMPLRVNEAQEIFFKDSTRAKSVVLRPTKITPFRIKPEQCFDSFKTFVDTLAPFEHSQPELWLLNKLIAIAGYVCKTFIVVSSNPEFGKSSIYGILDSLTQECPVFQPRSIPGILIRVTGRGNMVFDDIHATGAEVLQYIENFSFNVAGNAPIYLNGAMQSKNTKPKYDVAQQSITFLCNTWNNYKDPTKHFWDNLWHNKHAMQSRFLCLKLEGKLTEDFSKDFDIPACAEQNKLNYIRIAKHLLWMKQQRLNNTYARRWKTLFHSCADLKNRHTIIYDEITWIIDQYANTQEEYSKLTRLLDKAIADYQAMQHANLPTFPTVDMTGTLAEPFQTYVTPKPSLEQAKPAQNLANVAETGYKIGMETFKSRILAAFEKAQCKMYDIDDLKTVTGIEEIDLQTLLSEGFIMQSRPGFVQVTQ